MASRKIEVEILGDASSLNRALGSVTSRGSKFGSVMHHAVRAGALAAGAALGGLAVAAKVGYDELVQAQKASAQTAAVLESTGRAANVTAKHVRDLSAALLEKTGIDDEVIQQGENMLLTFRNIRNETGKGNDIFDQATKAALDMSTAMEGAGFEGGNLKTTAIRLGKALNDPVRGMTALRRVGVTFTKSQEKTIKKLVESGHILKAQKLILRELNKEFGGSAVAFGKTIPGQLTKLKEAFKNLAAEGVKVIIPLLKAITKWATAHLPQIATVFRTVFGAVNTVITTVKSVIENFLFATGGHFDHFGNLVETRVFKFAHVLNVMKDVASAVFGAVRNFITGTLIPAFQTMRGRVTEIVKDIAAVFRKRKPELTDIWNSVKDIVSTVARIFNDVVAPALRKILPKAIDIAIPAIRELARTLATVANALYTIVGAIKSVIEWFHRLPGGGGGGLMGKLGKLPGGNKGLLELLGLPGGAAGGIVTRPTLALIGEAGPEAVVPLNRMPGARALPSGGGTMVFNFPHYVGDRRELIAAMKEAFASYSRQNAGRSFI